MKKNKPLVVFIACVCAMALCMGLAAGVQSGFGQVKITTWHIDTDLGRITYKLYLPPEATEAAPAPAVLLMHGYQNDKETNAAFAIELARRGVVALSIDEYGHGDTSIPMRERGWGNVKITSPDKPLSGPDRYKVMMTFSTLEFFKKELSEGLKDSSMGGKTAFAFLKALPYVDETRVGVTGHSMGTWSSWTVGAAFPDHKAIVLQCGEVFPLDYYDSEHIQFNNVLLLQAQYDEFDNFRDYQRNVPGLEQQPLRYHDFMGQDAPVEWNHTYGAFEDGSARRMELLVTNHRLVTHNSRALATAMDWFATALGVNTNLRPTDQVYMFKEVLVLLGMLAALVSMLPAALLLTRTKFFAPAVQRVPNDAAKMLPRKSWRKNVLISILISGLTYPFLTQLGHGLFPFPEKVFRMTVGNGFIVWLTFLMLVSLVMLLLWYKRGEGKRMGVTLYDLGLAGEQAPNKYSWALIGKSALLALLLVGMVYLFVTVSVAITGLDFRFIWPFFRPFTPARLGQFLLYVPFYIFYFLISGGAKLYGQLRAPGRECPVRDQLALWGRSILIMLGGIFIIVLIEYIPFFLGMGPGADLLFSSTFGGPFMSIMILLVPQFIVFFFLSSYLQRRTGYVYVGSFVVAMLAAWVVTGGSAMF